MYTTQIDIDLSGERAPTVVYAKQGDVSARQLDIGFIENGSDYEIPDGTTARIWIKKPDGTAVYNEAVVSGGRVLAELTNQSLAAAGDARAEIALYQGNELLSSSVFEIRVERNARSESAAESSNEFGALDALLKEVDGKLSDITAAALAALQGAAITEPEIDLIDGIPVDPDIGGGTIAETITPTDIDSILNN